MKTDDLRKTFLEFFKSKGHKIYPSDSLVPDDPTIFFTCAGMNQFKPYFLGERKDCQRAASVQKCLRTDDLLKVGKTAYHHTFFEMLGNFSFGDYFKKEAIEFAWGFLTQHLNIKQEDLWISVYKLDEQAYRIWKDYIGVSQDRIVKLAEASNFWPANAPALGPNGPCGPCSEIFFDKGEISGCGRGECNPACDCGRFVEVWNLVFTQFNRVGENKLEPLPQRNIDTGMGIERMASVLQGKNTNFEIDILSPAVEFVKELLRTTNYPPIALRAGELRTTNSINAITDHTRAATFAIADGVYPTNEERGYVVRKIIRKAVWKGHLLGRRKAFLYELVSCFAELMKEPYPEINEKKEVISRVIRVEEERFLLTLENVKQQFSVIIDGLKKENKDIVGAPELFQFHDTYGFPLELSREIAWAHNMKIDAQGFEVLLKDQQERSRKRSSFVDSVFLKDSPGIKILKENKTKFVGYDCTIHQALVLLIRKGEKDVEVLAEGEGGLIILKETPFYPESGGQLSDRGIIKTQRGEFLVDEVFRLADAIIHKGRMINGKIQSGEIVNAMVEVKRRRAISRAHTAAHLLQAALRATLGAHVAQQGSLVDNDRLRFDFTHFEGIRKDNLKEIEQLVNKYILRGSKVEKYIMSQEEARKQGALAFFKDKYAEYVRVVSISNLSKELCAGTHLENTSGIGLFSIISESSISSGIRRIEAVVGEKAYSHFQILETNIKDVADVLNCNPQDLPNFTKKLKEELKKEKEKVEVLNKEILTFSIKDIVKNKKTVEGVNVLVYELPGASKESLLCLYDLSRKQISSLFVFFYSLLSKKSIFVCAVSDDIVDKGFSCKKFISLFEEELSLKGGGGDKLVQGVVTKRDNEFTKKIEDCIVKFLSV